MSSDIDSEEKCKTCGNSWEWHQEQQPRHPFNDGQAGATAFLGLKDRKRGHRVGDDGNGPQRGPQASPWPLDPVLRVALINKGVITPQDLRDAEEVIRATTAQFEQTVKESRDGQSTEEARRRKV